MHNNSRIGRAINRRTESNISCGTNGYKRHFLALANCYSVCEKRLMDALYVATTWHSNVVHAVSNAGNHWEQAAHMYLILSLSLSLSLAFYLSFSVLYDTCTLYKDERDTRNTRYKRGGYNETPPKAILYRREKFFTDIDLFPLVYTLEFLARNLADSCEMKRICLLRDLISFIIIVYFNVCLLL